MSPAIPAAIEDARASLLLGGCRRWLSDDLSSSSTLTKLNIGESAPPNVGSG